MKHMNKGGHLTVYDHNETTVSCNSYKYDKVNTDRSPFATHYVAHYADAKYETSPVTYGYRLVLVYSIFSDLENYQLASMIKNSNLPTLVHQALLPLFAKQNRIAILLERKYGNRLLQENNGCSAFVGRDLYRYNLLLNASAMLPVEKQLTFYIANVSLSYETIITADNMASLNKSFDETNDGQKDNIGTQEEKYKTMIWYDCEGKNVEWPNLGFSFFRNCLIDPESKTLDQVSFYFV
jgi:hypothetical protein